MTEIERVICTALNLYCFLNIWNEPTSEYRTNIRPVMLDDRSKYGSITMAGQNIQLPVTNEPFYIYSVDQSLFYNAFNLPKNKWLSATELCNIYNVLFHIYTEQGAMVHKSEIYVRVNPSNNGFIIAVAKNMLSRLCEHADANKIYMTVYFDSDFANKTTTYSFKVPARDLNGAYKYSIQQKLDELNDPMRMIVFMNGYEVTIKDVTSISDGDYFEIIHDKNIISDFTVDLTISKNDNVFYSDKDKTEKQLIHIPKNCNPNNKILTHNTCDFFIRRKYQKKYLSEGLYVHRCADRSITQVTHNDFGIPMFIVDAYRDNLDSQAITIRVVCRQHDKDNVLVRDKNYMDLLYTHNDDDIVRLLMGKVQSDLSFWKASNLEKSVYVGMMFDVPNTIVPENMYYYIEGLGYYHTLALICQRVITSVVTDLFAGFVNFNKPYLYMGRPILPIVYLNSVKIPQHVLTIVNDVDSGFSINFDKDKVHFNLGDKLAIEMFIDGISRCLSITPDETNNTLLVPYNEIILIEEKENDAYVTKGIDTTSIKSYVPITNFLGKIIKTDNSNGTCKLEFGSSLFGKKLIVQNKYCTHSITNKNNELNAMIATGDPIAFHLHTFTNEGDFVPIIGNANISVFLNNKYLIKDIDYKIIETYNVIDELSIKQCVISNMSYLKDTSNTIEIFVNVAEVEDIGSGFLKDNTIYNSVPINLWFDNISVSHIEGRLELNIVNHGTHMSVPESSGFRQGAPYEVQTCIPKLVKEFMDKYHPNDDRDKLIILNNYFYKHKPKPPAFITLPYSHRIYSIHMATIIRDIIQGELRGIAYDPDIKRMKDQVSSYGYLLKHDVIHSNTEIDYAFADAFATYYNYTISDVEMVNTIHAFIELFMPKDDVTSGEVIDVSN